MYAKAIATKNEAVARFKIGDRVKFLSAGHSKLKRGTVIDILIGGHSLRNTYPHYTYTYAAVNDVAPYHRLLISCGDGVRLPDPCSIIRDGEDYIGATDKRRRSLIPTTLRRPS